MSDLIFHPYGLELEVYRDRLYLRLLFVSHFYMLNVISVSIFYPYGFELQVNHYIFISLICLKRDRCFDSLSIWFRVTA